MGAPIELQARSGVRVVVAGRELVAFAGCDYLGLSTSPEVLEALRAGLERYGVSAGASRTTTGGTDAHAALEAALAEHLELEEAVLTPEGWLANVATVEALAGVCERAFIDADAHASSGGAARAAGLDHEHFEHADPISLARRIEARRCRAPLVMTDGLFPAAGRCAPLAELLAVLPAGGALLLDDAHGLGVLGARGAGTLERAGVRDGRIVSTGTLSKACGVYGGFVAGTHAWMDAVRASASYVGTTPLPPALAEAARVALRLLAQGELRATLAARMAGLRAALEPLGLPAPEVETPVVALGARSSAAGRALHAALLEDGLLVPFVDYPGGPRGAPGGWLRVALCAAHSEADVERLAAALLARRELLA